jgi:peptidyl-prolyl cis-trans isomerase B (cyclophilin B)
VSKKSRNRSLAKQHARRQAEKRRQRRRRTTAITLALVVGFAGLALAVLAFMRGGKETPAASGTPTPSASASASPSSKPGTVTGTVQPEAAPKEVACGGQVPKGATKPKPQFNAPAQVLKKKATYTATLRTSCGDIVIELLSDQAPQTANSFVFLAEQGYFDGTRIHRLDTSIDVIQGGDPLGTGSGGPGYTIPDELTGTETYGPGVVAMANAGANTGGSQFFIVTGPKGHNLDANPAYTIFGKVVEGMDVAQKIQNLPIQDPNGGIAGQQPAQAVYIEKVTIAS